MQAWYCPNPALKLADLQKFWESVRTCTLIGGPNCQTLHLSNGRVMWARSLQSWNQGANHLFSGEGMHLCKAGSIMVGLWFATQIMESMGPIHSNVGIMVDPTYSADGPIMWDPFPNDKNMWVLPVQRDWFFVTCLCGFAILYFFMVLLIYLTSLFFFSRVGLKAKSALFGQSANLAALWLLML